MFDIFICIVEMVHVSLDRPSGLWSFVARLSFGIVTAVTKAIQKETTTQNI